MNNINSINDDGFIKFLQSFCVETYNKSFEWMLYDPDFGDVLRWLYSKLDENNALTAREECRYTEIEKKGNLLSSEDLESALISIQDEYPGICLPGDQEAEEDLRLNLMMQKERLSMLEKQERELNELINQNEVSKQELDVELNKLNAEKLQLNEDEAVAAQECLQLADEVDSITNSVLDVVADTLNVYDSCFKDKENAKRFLTFGPLDSYRHLQAVFRSHFDLYTRKKFDKRSEDVTEDDLRAALVEAKSMEQRLTDGLMAYIESKCELSGEQAKLALVTNYTNIHPSQITSSLVEAQSALDLLKQEESILEQEVQSAVKELVERRTSLAVDTALKSALTVKEQVSKDLSLLLDITQQAVAVDRVLYYALRHELRSVEELMHFAYQLRLYVLDERDAVVTRVQAMNEICTEHDYAEQALETSDILRNTLSSILGMDSIDPVEFVKQYSCLVSCVQELKDNASESFSHKENVLEKYKNSAEPLKRYIFDGCTKQPNCRNRCLARMSHAWATEVGKVEGVVNDASELFRNVQDGDKQKLRKLWQWFLTDPPKLFAAMTNAETKG